MNTGSHGIMTPLSKHRKLYTSLRPALALRLNQHIRYSCTCEMTDLLYKLSPFQSTVQSVPHSIPTPKPRKVISTHDLCIIYGSDLASVAGRDFECLNILTIDSSVRETSSGQRVAFEATKSD